MMTETLIAKLKARRIKEGWSHRDLARELDVHHTTWYGIERGRHEIGLQTMQRIMRRFPEYTPDVLYLLQSNVSKTNSHVTISNGNEGPS